MSYYHYCALVHGMVGTFAEFCDIFLADKAPIGAMWTHVLGFWRRRHQANVLFLKYEDMKHDLAGTVRQCARFMEVDDAMLTEASVQTLCDHLQFSRMQRNPAVNLEPIISEGGVGGCGESAAESTGVKFIRKGMVGDWKNHMTAEMSAKFDEWIAVNTAGSDLTFDYE